MITFGYTLPICTRYEMSNTTIFSPLSVYEMAYSGTPFDGRFSGHKGIPIGDEIITKNSL